MCGRYIMTTELELLAAFAELMYFRDREGTAVLSHSAREAYDVFRERFDALTSASLGSDAYPSCIAPVITPHGGLTISAGSWGFGRTDGKGLIINARSEGMAVSRLFSPCLRAGRCVVPAAGYYEWKKTGSGKTAASQRFTFSPSEKSDGTVLYLAGLSRPSRIDPGYEYVVITRPASEEYADIHPRMPLIFTPENAARWLSYAPPEDIPAFDDLLCSASAG